MEVFYRRELGGIIVENIGVDGNLVDCFEGRQVTPRTRHRSDVLYHGFRKTPESPLI